MTVARVLPFGDAAVLVELGTSASIREARRARALAEAIAALPGAASAGLGTPVPAAASVLVPFDPLVLDATRAADLVRPLGDAALLLDPAPPPGAVEHVVPVAYGGKDGPDLAAVATELGLGADAVVELHAAQAYEVLFLGFAPGFAYLGELPSALAVPRLATPRVRVPAGSVAIAGTMTAVYPQASPGGWRIIGRTGLRLFDPGATTPALLRPGDRVRFRPA